MLLAKNHIVEALFRTNQDETRNVHLAISISVIFKTTAGRMSSTNFDETLPDVFLKTLIMKLG